jgi:phasin family protein
MYNATEQFAEFNKTNVAQATKFAALSLENAEKLVKFNLAATKAAIAQSVEGAQAVSTVKDVQDLLALRTKLAEAQVQHAMGYSRHLYEIATEAQAGYSAFAEEVFAVYTKGMASWVDQASKSAPAGSESAINAFKSTIAATTAAFDQFQKAGKQVVSLPTRTCAAPRERLEDRQGPQGCVSSLLLQRAGASNHRRGLSGSAQGNLNIPTRSPYGRCCLLLYQFLPPD